MHLTNNRRCIYTLPVRLSQSLNSRGPLSVEWRDIDTPTDGPLVPPAFLPGEFSPDA
jgi:hypothetical protein